MPNGKIAGKKLGWALALALFVLLPSLARAQSETVKLGDLAAISNAAIYIAIEKGFSRSRALTPKYRILPRRQRWFQPGCGELEVSVGSASAGLFNAVAQQAPFRIVADKGQTREGYGFSLLAVRKDLVDSGQVKTFKDLKGKKIAILAKGNIQHYLVGKMAEEVGLTINDVELSFLDAPNQVTAFETKAIDAAYAVEPWVARFTERGVAVRFRTPDQVKGLGPVQVGVIIYSGKFINERRPVAQRWMNAYLKAAELFHKNGTKIRISRPFWKSTQRCLPKLSKQRFRPIRIPTVRSSERTWRIKPNGLASNGMQQKVSIDSALDLSFLK